MRFLAAALSLLIGGASAAAAAAPASTPRPPPLPTETSDTAVLPPPGPHRLWVVDIYGGSARILDGDTGKMEGTVQSAGLSEFASTRAQDKVYVAETIWTKGVRGARQDTLTVYDGSTLKLKTEITLPGRLYMAPRPQIFALNASNTVGYVFNMAPASSVIMVDLKTEKVMRSVDVPGCALVFPWGELGFSSLCGNGALATVSFAGGAPSLTRGKPFFDAERDPVFQESPTDPATGLTHFVSYSGMVHPVRLGMSPVYDTPWSLQQAAGLKPAGVDDGALAWIPGGRWPLALHNGSGRLYVLMHAGEPWTHKKMGTELWVVDTRTRKVLRRRELQVPANALAVSQDERPLLYVVDEKYVLHVLDALTLESRRKVEGVGLSVIQVPGA